MRIYVAGIKGMVGSAIAAEAILQGYEVMGKSSRDLNFTNRTHVFNELSSTKPDALIIAAAKVGGIGANSRLPVDFLSENLQIQTNLLDAAHFANIKKVLFLGSSCVYPKFSQQPISEDALLGGKLEPTNEPYAIAKIAGLKLVEAYRKQYGNSWISVMPTNLYGPRDNFNLTSAHVLPSLIHRFHRAKIANAPEVEVWGDGSALREFLYVEDLARACLLVLTNYNSSTPINVGSGNEVSIRSLADLISDIVGYQGKLAFNSDFPNGTPRKFLDSHLISELGWKPLIDLKKGITLTYDWFVTNLDREIHL